MKEIKSITVSKETMKRWWLFLLLLVVGLAILFSSVYFLYFPNGFQGGRNPDYKTIILFGREIWDTIHLWAGIGMIIVLVIHIAMHTKWIVTMGKRLFQRKSNRLKNMKSSARFNIILNTIAAFSFMVAALTGIVLMFYPSGRNVYVVNNFIFTKAVWDLIHTWSGVIMLISAVLHLYIHWKWVTKVTKRVIRSKNQMALNEKMIRSSNG